MKNNPIKNTQKGLKEALHKMGCPNVQKKHSTSFLVTEVQIETIMIYHYTHTPTKMARETYHTHTRKRGREFLKDRKDPSCFQFPLLPALQLGKSITGRDAQRPCGSKGNKVKRSR